MKVGELIQWNGRLGLITKVTSRAMTVLFTGDPPFEYLFDHQWFQWAKRKKDMIVMDELVHL